MGQVCAIYGNIGHVCAIYEVSLHPAHNEKIHNVPTLPPPPLAIFLGYLIVSPGGIRRKEL